MFLLSLNWAQMLISSHWMVLLCRWRCSLPLIAPGDVLVVSELGADVYLLSLNGVVVPLTVFATIDCTGRCSCCLWIGRRCWSPATEWCCCATDGVCYHWLHRAMFLLSLNWAQMLISSHWMVLLCRWRCLLPLIAPGDVLVVSELGADVDLQPLNGVVVPLKVFATIDCTGRCSCCLWIGRRCWSPATEWCCCAAEGVRYHWLHRAMFLLSLNWAQMLIFSHWMVLLGHWRCSLPLIAPGDVLAVSELGADVDLQPLNGVVVPLKVFATIDCTGRCSCCLWIGRRCWSPATEWCCCAADGVRYHWLHRAMFLLSLNWAQMLISSHWMVLLCRWRCSLPLIAPGDVLVVSELGADVDLQPLNGVVVPLTVFATIDCTGRCSCCLWIGRRCWSPATEWCCWATDGVRYHWLHRAMFLLSLNWAQMLIFSHWMVLLCRWRCSLPLIAPGDVLVVSELGADVDLQPLNGVVVPLTVFATIDCTGRCSCCLWIGRRCWSPATEWCCWATDGVRYHWLHRAMFLLSLNWAQMLIFSHWMVLLCRWRCSLPLIAPGDVLVVSELGADVDLQPLNGVVVPLTVFATIDCTGRCPRCLWIGRRCWSPATEWCCCAANGVRYLRLHRTMFSLSLNWAQMLISSHWMVLLCHWRCSLPLIAPGDVLVVSELGADVDLQPLNGVVVPLKVFATIDCTGRCSCCLWIGRRCWSPATEWCCCATDGVRHPWLHRAVSSLSLNRAQMWVFNHCISGVVVPLTVFTILDCNWRCPCCLWIGRRCWSPATEWCCCATDGVRYHRLHQSVSLLSLNWAQIWIPSLQPGGVAVFTCQWRDEYRTDDGGLRRYG